MQQKAKLYADPLVSIIVPVYNAETYLSQCVESLLTQTHHNLELIFVDDGSTDGSPTILDAYAEQDGRVVVIHQPNSGVSAARNAGLDTAHGDFIGFTDSDDWAEPDYVEQLLQIFSEHPGIDVSIAGWYVHDHPYGTTSCAAAGSGKPLSSRDAIYYAVDIGKSFEGYPWNKLFRAEIFQEMQNGQARFRFDPSVSVLEDLLLAVEIFASGRSAYYSTQRVYHYRFRESSALHTYGEARDGEFKVRERIESICRSFDEKLLRTAQLSTVKSAFNLLVWAKENKDQRMYLRMRQRICTRIRALLLSCQIPLFERCKLIVRILFPVSSLRLFRRLRARHARAGIVAL